MNFESRGEYPDEFDRFSGKGLDDELDREEELDTVSSEDVASDFKNITSGIYNKIPRDFQETFDDIFGNIELYYDPNDKDWKKKVIDPLNELIDNLAQSDRNEIEDKEDEFATLLAEIQRESLALKKNKVH